MINVGVERLAIFRIRVSIVVIVLVHTVRAIVAIEIGIALVHQRVAIVVDAIADFLCCIVDCGVKRSTVGRVRVPIVVAVIVQAVENSVLVYILESLINLIVAVVVDAITDFLCSRKNEGVEGFAILFIQTCVVVIISIRAIRSSVAVRIRKPLIDLTVAIVVDSIADLLCSRINLWV